MYHDNVIKQIEYKNHTIKIFLDDNAPSPREFMDNLGTIAYKHSRYELGDEEIDCPLEFIKQLIPDDRLETLENKEDKLWYQLENEDLGYFDRKARDRQERLHAELFDMYYVEAIKHAVILPVSAYIHGGVTIKVGSFSCPWDSGQIGFIYARREDILKEFGRKRLTKSLRERAERALEAEIELFDKYLRGEYYGYVVHSPDGEELDSLWGIDDIDYALETAKHSVDCAIKQKQKYHFKTLKDIIKQSVPLQYREPCPV